MTEKMTGKLNMTIKESKMQGRSTIRRAFFFTVTTFLLAGLSSVCGLSPVYLEKTQADESPAKRATRNGENSFVEVKPGKMNIWLNLEGIYESTAFDEIVLEPKQWKTLKVKKVVPHGSAVMEGDPVLWLETDELDKELEKQKRALVQAELSLRLASEELRFLKESTAMNLDAVDRAAKIAKEELDYFQKVREQQEIKSANMNLKFAKYSLENAQEELNQLQQMYEADDLTEQTEEIILKRAKRAVESAEFSLERAELSHARRLTTLIPREKQALIDAQANAALNRAKSIVTLPMILRSKELDVEKQQRDVEELGRKITELEHDREMMTIFANRSGLIYYGRCVNGKWNEISTRAKQLKPSGTVSPKTVLMTVVDPTALRVRLSLTQEQLALARQGQLATFKPKAHLNYFSRGKLTEVTPVLQSDGKFLALATTSSHPDYLITPGMTCQVKVQVYAKENVLSVPASMVHLDEFSDDPRPYVWLGNRKAGSQKKQFVKTGYRDAGRIEILSGLKPGDIVWPQKP